MKILKTKMKKILLFIIFVLFIGSSQTSLAADSNPMIIKQDKKVEHIADCFDEDDCARINNGSNWDIVETEAELKSPGDSADLGKMGLLAFNGPKSFQGLATTIIKFLGYAIILAAVVGLMVGGSMLIISAGDENMFNQGKDVLTASLIGLVVTLLAYLIVTLVQSIVYSVSS